jgi:hypothetical protein
MEKSWNKNFGPRIEKSDTIIQIHQHPSIRQRSMMKFSRKKLIALVVGNAMMPMLLDPIP